MEKNKQYPDRLPEDLFSNPESYGGWRVVRTRLLRWVTAKHIPYPHLDPTDPRNLFFETLDRHISAGHIVINRIPYSMPAFSAAVAVDCVRIIWDFHDDGEPVSGSNVRPGFESFELQNVRDPYCKADPNNSVNASYPWCVSAREVFAADLPAPSADPVEDEGAEDTVTEQLQIIRQKYEALGHGEGTDYPALPQDYIAPDSNHQEAARFRSLEHFIRKVGGMFDYIDLIAAGHVGFEDAITPETAEKLKRLFITESRKKPPVQPDGFTITADNVPEFIPDWFAEFGSFHNLQKQVYELYDLFGALDEQAAMNPPGLSPQGAYDIKLAVFRYTFPETAEALTAKWLDKFVGLYVGMNGPFQRNRFPEHAQFFEVADHIRFGFKKFLGITKKLMAKLEGNTRAQEELLNETLGLLGYFARNSYDEVCDALYCDPEFVVLFDEIDPRLATMRLLPDRPPVYIKAEELSQLPRTPLQPPVRMPRTWRQRTA